MITWTPHPYQEEAIRLLISQGSAGILLDPGMGKTTIALAAASILKKQGLLKRGMLVIAPLRPAYSVWPREIDKWLEFEDLTYAVVHGPHREQQLKHDVDVYITTPEELPWLFSKPRREWDVLCIDESTKFKDSQTKRFKTLKPHLERFPRRWILTGTIVPNGLMDLFGQIYVLDLGRALGRFITHYRKEYFFTEAYNHYSYFPKEGAFEKIVDRIDPLVMRLKATDHLKMPALPKLDPILVDLPPKVRRLYSEVENEFITQLDSGKVIIAANAGVAGGKCRQICNGALYTDENYVWEELHTEKIDALGELIESLCGAPALVMYEFQHDRERLLRRFGRTTPVIGGGTSPVLADQYLEEFNRGKHPIMFCNPASMAHGLNLQEACHHIIWFALTWNLEYYLQSIARIYRQGQKNPFVMVHHIVVRNSRDEAVVAALQEKDATQEKVYAALRYNIPTK